MGAFCRIKMLSLAIAIFGATCSLLYLAVLYYQHFGNVWKLASKFPGPKGLPLIGSALYLKGSKNGEQNFK